MVLYQSKRITKLLFYPLKMSQLQIHNRKEFENIRKSLRKKLTAAEATLWVLLKDKQLDGRKFRRQHSLRK